jgi:hypothetical protein
MALRVLIIWIGLPIGALALLAVIDLGRALATRVTRLVRRSTISTHG